MLLVFFCNILVPAIFVDARSQTLEITMSSVDCTATIIFLRISDNRVETCHSTTIVLWSGKKQLIV